MSITKYAVYSSVTDPSGFEMKLQEDGEYIHVKDLNKIKADAVRQVFALISGGKVGAARPPELRHHLQTQRNRIAKWVDIYADKLENGEVSE